MREEVRERLNKLIDTATDYELYLLECFVDGFEEGQEENKKSS